MKKILKRIFNPDGKNMIPKDEDAIDYLILNGGIEITAIDPDNGEFLYSFTDKIKELMPNMYEEHIRSVNSNVLHLWEKGFLDINFMENDPIIRLSAKAFNNEEISMLSDEDQWNLNEIKRLLRKN